MCNKKTFLSIAHKIHTLIKAQFRLICPIQCSFANKSIALRSGLGQENGHFSCVIAHRLTTSVCNFENYRDFFLFLFSKIVIFLFCQ